MEKGPDATQVESYGSSDPPAKPGFGTKLKNHYKRFWWVHVITTICVVLLITLILVYVGFPRIAQSGVNKSTLDVQSLNISDPTPNSFHIHQVTVTSSSSSYHPNLDAFNASLSLAGSVPYAQILIPPVHATKEATAVVDQTVQITDIGAFTAYNTALLDSVEVNVTVAGRTGLHEMKFPETTVNFNKTVTMKGLNKLQGFNITTFQLLTVPDPDGTNMIGNVYIPNPSVLTVAMGNVTMNNYVQGQYIGNATLENLVLTPGDNNIQMRAISDQLKVIQLIESNYTNGILPIDIIGNSSVYNGQHLTYFEQALATNTQHINLNVGQALAAMGVKIPPKM